MKFQDYIGIGPEQFQREYLDTRLVDVAHHDIFPLSLYTYGRECVHSDKWDDVTSKCRGIIVNNVTGDIVARPFEKFHNYGSTQQTADPTLEFLMSRNVKPTVWEKMDGFLITGYQWEGIWYAASKGSFHSIHAKWATAELRRLNLAGIPSGFTPVFEGLHPDLRIVVDYGTRKELVLLALIDNQTGTESGPQHLRHIAANMGTSIPRSWDMSLQQAVELSRAEEKGEEDFNDEGYVMTWYAAGRPPYRLKLKFIEYLRLHRIVCGTSPRRIWEALANGWQTQIDEYILNSPVWFADFAKKWILALKLEFNRQKRAAESIYKLAATRIAPMKKYELFRNMGEERKWWAEEFNKPEHKEFASILFSMLDNKDSDKVIWKRLREMTRGTRPLVDAHS